MFYFKYWNIGLCNCKYSTMLSNLFKSKSSHQNAAYHSFSICCILPTFVLSIIFPYFSYEIPFGLVFFSYFFTYIYKWDHLVCIFFVWLITLVLCPETHWYCFNGNILAFLLLQWYFIKHIYYILFSFLSTYPSIGYLDYYPKFWLF